MFGHKVGNCVWLLAPGWRAIDDADVPTVIAFDNDRVNPRSVYDRSWVSAIGIGVSNHRYGRFQYL